MATRAGSYLKQRLRDLFLIVVWLVVLFQVAQIIRIEKDDTTRQLLSLAAVFAIGLAATYLWWRSRSRSRSGAGSRSRRSSRRSSRSR